MLAPGSKLLAVFAPALEDACPSFRRRARRLPSRALGRACLYYLLVATLLTAAPVAADLQPEQYVLANGSPIDVPQYGVPSLVDWNNDGMRDLLVGEGGQTADPGKVRVYLNSGTDKAPVFTTFSYVQTTGGDLTEPSYNCLGAFPRAVYWDGDDLKDLIVGNSYGNVKFYRNLGTDSAPLFDTGTYLQVGLTGFKTNIDVGDRACVDLVDWNSDGRKDLVVGAYDKGIHIFLNSGTDSAPDFQAESWAMENGTFLEVPDYRSSPDVVDWDGDGKKDLIAGNSYGLIYFYRNTGTDSAPSFSGHVALTAGGTTIDLPGSARSRPFVCDWNLDRVPDLLVGSDGPVRLFLSPSHGGDANQDGSVDDADQALLYSNYGLEGKAWSHGDFNADGVVNVGDLGIFAANTGWVGLSGLQGGIFIPEPTCLVLLVLTGAAFRRPR